MASGLAPEAWAAADEKRTRCNPPGAQEEAVREGEVAGRRERGVVAAVAVLVVAVVVALAPH